MTRTSVSALTLTGVLLFGGSLSAQESRLELINQARLEFDQAAIVGLLMRAANPESEPRDSLWTVAVYDMAEALVETEADLSATLVRWAARHGAQWAIDREFYSDAVLQAYDGAALAGEGDLTGMTTSWRWPATLTSGALGTLQVTATDPSTPLTVSVAGQGAMPASGNMDLPPDSYELTVFAEGFDSMVVSREVLPGAATVLEVELAPLLPAEVESDVRSGLVRIMFDRGGTPICRNGILDAQGLVLTLLSGLEQGTSFAVTTAQGSYSNVPVLRTDPTRGLAVLDLGTGSSNALTRASGSAGQHVWSVFNAGCGAPALSRSRLANWTETNPVSLLELLPANALGAPVVDLNGALLGLVSGPDQIIPRLMAQQLLAAAIVALSEDEADPQLSSVGGAFPIAWLGAGAAAVGLAVVVLGGGGGGGGDGGGDPIPTTGSITVTFPGGAP